MVKNIAIDGPAGAGKSSLAKAVARQMGFIYVDTGALYRAIGLFVLENGKNTKFEDEVVPLLDEISIRIGFVSGEQHVFINDNDVSEKIRMPEVSMAASDVSAIPKVRKFLFDLQLKLAKENDVIMDGRDIGTVVLPNADIKIFLTASPEERANRRFLQLSEKENCPTYEEILADIIQRDYNDSHRKIAPLKQADDAILVDTTNFTKEESIELLEKIINEKLGVGK